MIKKIKKPSRPTKTQVYTALEVLSLSDAICDYSEDECHEYIKRMGKLSSSVERKTKESDTLCHLMDLPEETEFRAKHVILAALGYN